MKNEAVRLAVCGALGRMGSRVLELARSDVRFSVTARVVKGRTAAGPGSTHILASELPRFLRWTDVVVDFSAPGQLAYVELAARHRRPIVIGSTGFSPSQLKRIRALSRQIPVFLSPNLSRGVNLMFYLAKNAARLLPGYETGISETHHKMKRDSPSGTALALAEAVRSGRGGGKTVPIVAQRLGDVIGEHTLTLAGPFERLEITHRAHSRDIFASGALEAALWVRRKRPGLYDMRDLMGIR